MLLISIITGFLLVSNAFLEQTAIKVALLITFGIVGLISARRQDLAYFGLLFVFPLLPSIPRQVGLPNLHLEEFLMLSFTFWWSLKKGLPRHKAFHQIPLAIPLTILLIFFGLSTMLALIRYNIVLSDIFWLKIKDHWNIFLPWSSLEDVGTLRAMLTITEGVLFYFITLDLLDQKQKAEKALRLFLYSAFFVALLGVLQFVFQFQLLEHWLNDNFGLSRINSTFADPNSLGAYLAAALGSVYFAFSRRKLSTLILLMVIASALFLSGSRSSWIPLVVVVLLLPLFARRLQCDPAPHVNNFLRFVFKYGYLLLLALVILGCLKVSLYGRPIQRPSGMGSLQHIRARWNVALSGRLGVWQGALLMFRADPIYGNGLGTFPRAIGKYKQIVKWFFRKENAHNYYLQLLAETGILGLSLFLFVMFLVVRQGFRLLQTTSTRDEYLPAYGLFSAILIFLVASLAQHPLLLLKLQLVFWFLIGTLMALTLPFRKQEPRRPMHFGRLMIWIAVACLPLQIYSVLQTRRVPPYEYGFGEWQDRPEPKTVPFRIIKPHTISLLPVRKRVLAIDFSALQMPSQEKPEFVEIYINKQFIDRVVFFKTGWQTFICNVSRYQPNELVRLELISGPPQTSLRTAVRPFQWRYR